MEKKGKTNSLSFEFKKIPIEWEAINHRLFGTKFCKQTVERGNTPELTYILIDLLHPVKLLPDTPRKP